MKLTPRVQVEKVRRLEGRLHLQLTLRNDGETPIFFVPRIRRLALDADGALDLWLAPQGPPVREPGFRREFSVPRTRAVEPGDTARIELSVAENLTRFVPCHGAKDGARFELEPCSLTEVQRVRVHLAVADKPFYFNPSLDLGEQCAGWGERLVVEGRIERAASAT